MFYFSYLIDEYSSKTRPTKDEYIDLYKHLPMQSGSIWGEDKYHIADVNGYLIPTKFNIILYADVPLNEKSLPSELNFECGSIIDNNINAHEFDRIVETIRCFETRRNLYLMNKAAHGKSVLEYSSYYDSLRNFDITSSKDANRMMMFNVASNTVEAKPNYRVSESFLQEFFGGNYEKYTNAKLNSINYGADNTPDLESFYLKTNVRTKEEWNTKIVNWINRNIYDLANIGFCNSNFPDIIFFSTTFSDRTSLPYGSVHKIKTNENNISKLFSRFKKS